MSAEDEAAARKAKADRAKKLKRRNAEKQLAQRQKAKAKASASAVPSSPTSTINDGVAASTRTSLSLDESVRGEISTASPTQALNGISEAATITSPVPEEPKAEKEEVQMPPPPAPAPKTPIISSSPSLTASPRIPDDPNSTSAQTVSLLLAERTDLQNQLVSLKSQLEEAKGDTKLLNEGRELIAKLEEENRQLTTRAENAEEGVGRIAGLENDLAASKARAEGLEKEKDELQARLDEQQGKRDEAMGKLEGQVAELERTLERTRGREGGLEAEVGRLKQVCHPITPHLERLTRESSAELSKQISSLNSDLETSRESATSTEKQLSELQSTYTTLSTTHDELKSSHDTLTTEKSDLQTKLSKLQEEHGKLQKDHTASSGSSSSLQIKLEKAEAELESLRTNLANEKKRAEGVEKKRDGLQSDNAELVKQLEEVRGKVVKSMEEKVEMAAVVESWETKGKAWEKARGELEGKAAEANALRDQISSLSESNRHLSTMSATHDLLKREHSDLQSELENLQNDVTFRDETINSLRLQLDTRPRSESNGSAGPSTPSKHRRQESDKMKKLEASLHASSSKVYELERQLAELQISFADVERARDQAVASASRSPPQGGLFLAPPDGSGPVRRGSPGIGVDAILPAAVRHKRQVSLTALKARMAPHRTVSTRMDAVDEDGSGSPTLERDGGLLGISELRKAPQQFGDEIVGCCPACDGPLISL